MIENGNKDLVEIIKEIPKKKTKLSWWKAGEIFGISKSSICTLWSSKEAKVDNNESNNERLLHNIYDILVEHKFRIRRKSVAYSLKNDYGITFQPGM